MNIVQNYNNISSLVIDYVFGSKPQHPDTQWDKWEKRIDEVFQLAQLIENLKVAIFGTQNACPSELIPYRIIRFFAEDHCEIFYKTVLNNSGQRIQKIPREELNHFIQSCVHTSYAAAAIFLGEKSNSSIMALQWKTELKVKLPYSMHVNSPPPKVIHLKNVLPENTPQQEKDTFLTNLNTYVSSFNSLKECHIKNYTSFILSYILGEENIDKFDFNSKNINSFNLEILSKSPSPSKSYLASIFICTDESKAHHFFQIEYFFSSSAQEGLFRLIHSWVNIDTLFENFCGQGFDEGIRGCWDLEKMKRFLKNLEKIYQIRNLKFRKYQTGACFNYNISVPSAFSFSFKQNGQKIIDILTATTFRFVISEFNPSDALIHAAKIVQSSETFKKALGLN